MCNVASFGQLQAIAEACDITNAPNFDVQSVQGGQRVRAPAATDPAMNTTFARYNAALQRASSGSACAGLF